MIVFYPAEIDMWKSQFDFHPPITCIQHAKENYKFFSNRKEFIDFLKDSGIRLNDPTRPLRFADTQHPDYGPCQSVSSKDMLLGWFKDDYR